MTDFISRLATEHEVEVIFQSFEGSEAFVMGTTIFIDPDQYEPRKNWIFCHELAHLLLDHPQTTTASSAQEKEADALAAELLLPESEFRQPAETCTLAELKKMFPHASWEAIALRRIFFKQAVLTIYDNMQFTRRTAPRGFNYPKQLTPPEKEVLNCCYNEKTHHSVQSDGLRIEGYYIDENPKIIRVILITELLDDID